MNSGIYAITNIENNKVYIGLTVNFKTRWYAHKKALRHNNHCNPHLQSSWNKHGESAFEFGVLEYMDDLEQLHLAEQFWVDVYREEGKELYNIGTPGRAPWLGQKRSEETCRRISEAKRGSKLSEEAKYNISQGLLSMDPEVRVRCSRIASKVHTGNQYGLGYRHTEEAVQKISEASKLSWASGVYDNKETRRRKSMASSRLRHTEETKQHLREIMLARPPMPKETRQKISETLIGRETSEETRLKLSRPYPAFIHKDTGEIIPAGRNLSILGQERGLWHLRAVVNGTRGHDHGWVLLENQ